MKINYYKKIYCKAKKVLPSIISCILLTATFNSCKSMNELLEEYNKNFTSANSTGEKEGHAMIVPLSIDIHVGNGYQIGSPNWVNNSKWTLYKIEDEKSEVIIVLNKKDFSHHFKDAGIYSLKLQAVSNENGNLLEDSIFIHVF